MMFFQDASYPQCAHLMRHHVIGIPADTQVFRALEECIGKRTLVEQVLAAGTYPRLIVARLVRNGEWQKNVGGNYRGECDAADLNYVYINKNIAQGVEEGNLSSRYFEQVLLHEVVHWGRHIAGLPAEIDGREAGSWFEHLAYGVPYIGHSGFSCT